MLTPDLILEIVVHMMLIVTTAPKKLVTIVIILNQIMCLCFKSSQNLVRYRNKFMRQKPNVNKKVIKEYSRNRKKNLLFSRPTQLAIQGQWWSICITQR